MITPFAEDDTIDRELLAEEARFHSACGVNGLVVAGSTGEGAGMTPDEVAECVTIVRNALNDRIPVIAGVIADNSAEAVAIARTAARAGASGLQVPPPAYRPSTDIRVLSAYYQAITDATGLPLIIYNVIPWAQVAIDSLEEMIARNNLIIGVKQSGRNFHALADLLAHRVTGAKIYSAIDDMLYPSFMLGADGTISGTASVFPAETIELMRAVESRNFERALQLHNILAPVWRTVDQPDFPARIKYVLRLMGRPAGRPRRPFDWPTAPVAESIRQALERGGLLRPGVQHQSSLVAD